MRRFSPVEPPRDFDYRLVNILKNLNAWASQAQQGFAKIQRGETPNSDSTSIAAVMVHKDLLQLVYPADDHTQYANLYGRTGGQTWIGDPKTTLTGTDVGITLKSFNGANTVSGPAMMQLLDENVTIYCDNLFVYERGQTVGWQINTGLGFATQQITGGLQLTGLSAANITPLQVEHGTLGITAATVTIKGRSGQTGKLTEWRDSNSATLSSIRASDGAFVGPVAPTQTLDLLNTTYFDDVTAGSAARGAVIVGDSSGKWAKVTVGTSGYVLTSDGTDVSWQPSGTAHNLLSTTHSDTTAHAVVRGDLVTGQTGPVWARLALGVSGKFLSSDGTDVVWADPPAGSAHNILSSTHSDTLADSVVKGDVLIGNATPKWSRLGVGSTGDVLTVQSGGTVAWAAPSASSAHNILSSTHSDTTAASVVRGDIITGQAATPLWKRLAVGTSKQVVSTDGTDVVWASLDNSYLADRTNYIYVDTQQMGDSTGSARSNGTDTEVETIQFSGTADAFRVGTFIVPYDLTGTNFTAIKLYWAPTSNMSGAFSVWQIGLAKITAGNDWRNGFTFGSVTVSASVSATDVLSILSLNLPSISLAAGDVVKWKIWRKATDTSDTYASIATINGIRFEYTGDH